VILRTSTTSTLQTQDSKDLLVWVLIGWRRRSLVVRRRKRGSRFAEIV
jgi:hypothetical protein